MKEYLTIDGEYSNTTVIERSKFICYLKGIQDEEEARSFIEKIRKQNSLATHNCYAYIADEKGLVQKFSDDGEPQGTAGMPMLNALRGNKLFKTVAVVTRYFGGVKLGAGGLVRAYGGSVSDCVELAGKSLYRPIEKVKISCDYDGYSKVMNTVSEFIAVVISNDFTDKMEFVVAVAKDENGSINRFCDRLVDVFNGRVSIEKLEEGYYPFK